MSQLFLFSLKPIPWGLKRNPKRAPRSPLLRDTRHFARTLGLMGLQFKGTIDHFTVVSLVSQALSDPAWGWGWPCFDNKFDTNPFPLLLKIRAIFVWPWNENAPTKQKQQTNENRAIWLVYRTDTNALVFGWLSGRSGEKNFLEINQYHALTSYCNLIGQSKNVFSILGFSLAGKRSGHVLIFPSTGW